MKAQENSALGNIWKSRLVWRIASALFVVILLVNTLFSVMSLSQFEKDRLFDLREVGLYTIIPLLAANNNRTDPSQPPINSRSHRYQVWHIITPHAKLSEQKVNPLKSTSIAMTLLILIIMINIMVSMR